MDGDFRAERRRFILAAHPDRGGDARAFVAGLQRFDDAATTHLAPTNHSADTHLADTVTDGPGASWPVSLLTRLLRGLSGWRERRR